VDSTTNFCTTDLLKTFDTVNHHVLYKNDIVRVPVELLLLLFNKNIMFLFSCIKWVMIIMKKLRNFAMIFLFRQIVYKSGYNEI